MKSAVGIRAVLDRYIVVDPAVSALGKPEWRVPRFLLNDVVRLWRTIAVDYATKKWERGGKAWALKNIKLRMSRKLLFVKGLLMCFLCEDAAPDGVDTEDGEAVLRGIASKCYELARLSPMDVLCSVLQDHAEAETARTIVSCYDQFLGVLDSEEDRTKLEELDAESAVEKDLFRSLRKMSHRYSGGLEELFFDSEFLRPLTRMYGVF